jgi:hypothetical protein
MKQTTRYQSKEDLRRIGELYGCVAEETTDPIPDTPGSIDTTVPTTVPPTAGISTLVTTITTTGPTSITTIIDNTGTTTPTIISTVVPGINLFTEKEGKVFLTFPQLTVNRSTTWSLLLLRIASGSQ